MKKRVLIFSILIIIFIGIIGISYNSNNKHTFTQDGITYALTLDGASVNTFPEKGIYRVDVTCENATGKWLYDEWVLAIENVNGDNITCDIAFNTIAKTNLNTYITGLTGATQGDGEVVDEMKADYTNALAISQSSYSDITMYSSSSYSSTSGTANTDAYTFSESSWTTVPSNMTSSTYYHIKFRPSSSGYYQVCYTMSSGESRNRMYVYIGTTQQYFDWQSYTSASESSSKNECIDIGYVDSSTDVRIVQLAYKDNSAPIATITFNLQEATSIESADVGIRYEGKNPNNYIWFNNELWRIIGVFDEGSHGVSGQNLVKIIRANSIGGLVWNYKNVSSGNDWTQSILMNLLNGAYLNAEDGTGGEYCYGNDGTYNARIPSNCDYRSSGISSTYRGMIESVRWYLGGASSNSATAESFYRYERGDSVYSGRPTYWDGMIGLMYPSDYGYSVLSSSCARRTNFDNYDLSTCAGESWLYGQGYEWTITPRTDDESAYYLSYEGKLNNGSRTGGGYSVRPVLYLNSNVYVLDGDGSITDPYIIGM